LIEHASVIAKKVCKHYFATEVQLLFSQSHLDHLGRTASFFLKLLRNIKSILHFGKVYLSTGE